MSEFTSSGGVAVRPWACSPSCLVIRDGGSVIVLDAQEQVEIGAWLMSHGRNELRKRRAAEERDNAQAGGSVL